MNLIKLPEISSTNTYLKTLLKIENLPDFTIVWTEKQTQGRGQQNNKWISEPYKNLTFSVLKKIEDFPAEHHFILNMVVSLSIINALKRVQIPKLSIKWPNDILAGTKKICGILIENTLQTKYISESIIGIGVNVNQLFFENLPNVSSLQKITGIHFHLEEILTIILNELEKSFQNLEKSEEKSLFKKYETLLFRKDKVSSFKDTENQIITGFLRGVTEQGELRVELEDYIEKTFKPKEIQLLY